MFSLDTQIKKPLVGFFPGFFDMGETYPLIKIARWYRDLGGEVVFFSHGGEYEYLAADEGFKIIQFDIQKSLTPTERAGFFFRMNDDDLIRFIEKEASTFNKAGIKALVHPNVYFSCILACRLAKIPLVSIISGAWTPNFYKQNRGTFPDDFENFFTQLIPSSFKNRFSNWHMLNGRGPIIKKLNRIAKRIDIDLYFKSNTEMSYGDYTFVCDDIDFLGLKPTRDFPAENYIGPILPDEWNKAKPDKFDADIEDHLKRPGKSILLTMGSSFVMKEIFLDILKILNQTDYNVVATYTDILNADELPDLNDNILLKKFITNINSLNSRVDLAVIHGGRGTVYTAAYSGKPIIGIPYMVEQQFNLDCLVRHGTAIRLSKKYFKDKDLLDAVDKIFDNYDFYLKNAERLANKLPLPEGGKNAANKILEIIR